MVRVERNLKDHLFPTEYYTWAHACLPEVSWVITGPLDLISSLGLPPIVPTKETCLAGVRNASATLHKGDCPQSTGGI